MTFEIFEDKLRWNVQRPETLAAVQSIANRVPGWSGLHHYAFFKSMFEAFPIRTVLIIGCYMGRDISFMLHGSPRGLQVVGVDKFDNTPCDDWPEEKRHLSWEQAGFGPAPSIDLALANINAQPPHEVRLIQADDAVWLESVQGQFDFCYLDTSHDKATVMRQIRQIRKLCHPATIIAGDDYENIVNTWGVKDAVLESFTSHSFIPQASVWYASTGDLK